MRGLEELAQEGKIKEKVYGKQKVYVADQVIMHLGGGDWLPVPAMAKKRERIMENLQENIMKGDWLHFVNDDLTRN